MIEIIEKFKCYNCGKIFIDNKDLHRHKNRKTPCLIHEILPDQLANPNRCIFCNKIFANIGNRNKHLKICKIKNGGMGILDKKIRHEEEIRILKEQREHDNIEIQKLKEQNNKIKILEEKLEAMEKRATNATNTTNNINLVNQVNNITVNFYNYDKPKIDTLHITQDDLLVENVTKKIIELIYFNKSIPENHVLYRPNLKEQRLLVYKDNSWKNITGKELEPIFCNVKNVTYLTGIDKINSGEIYRTDDEFYQLYPVVQATIQKFNRGEQITDGTIMEIITENRNMIKETIKNIE